MNPEQHQRPQHDVAMLFKDRLPLPREVAAVIHYYEFEGWPRQNARVAELWTHLRKLPDKGVGLLTEILNNKNLLARPRPAPASAASNLVQSFFDLKHQGIDCERYNTVVDIVRYLKSIRDAAAPAIPALLSCVDIWYSHGTDDFPEYASSVICPAIRAIGVEFASIVIPLAKNQLVGQLDPVISEPLLKLIHSYNEPDIVALDWSSQQALALTSANIVRDLTRKARRLFSGPEDENNDQTDCA